MLPITNPSDNELASGPVVLAAYRDASLMAGVLQGNVLHAEAVPARHCEDVIEIKVALQVE